MAARYIRPISLTWWSGVGAVATGIAKVAMPSSFALTETGRLISMLAGGVDASPAGLVFMGLGLIGVRDYLERAYAVKEDTDKRR